MTFIRCMQQKLGLLSGSIPHAMVGLWQSIRTWLGAGPVAFIWQTTTKRSLQLAEYSAYIKKEKFDRLAIFWKSSDKISFFLFFWQFFFVGSNIHPYLLSFLFLSFTSNYFSFLTLQNLIYLLEMANVNKYQSIKVKYAFR